MGQTYKCEDAKHRKSWEVVRHEHLPDWLQNKVNEYLIHGHRPELSSFYECSKSIFHLHSETGNIWTHLIGCAVFLLITIVLILSPSDLLAHEVRLVDQIVFVIYGLGAVTCLMFSFLFHTFACHSEEVGRFFQKLDYCGIAVLIVASFVPWLYYSFYCEPIARSVYMTICLTLGSCCTFISLSDQYLSSQYRGLRAALFVIFGLSGVFPAIHYVALHGFADAINVAALHWLVLMAILYISGAVIYAQRFPERWWPGKFDYWGQSHQIFHILVIAAAFAHYHGVKIVAVNMTTIGRC